MTTERPASIEGGMIPAEPHRRREDAATWSYAVVWEIADGRRAYVRTPPLWRGPMGPAMLAWFRAEVERHMALHPPV